MISITEKQNCCGCTACVAVCPKQCITLNEDSEGFLYPSVNKEQCSNCGLCEKVCPFANPYEKRTPIKVAAAINKDEKIRLQSSSGGLFTILAESVIKEGGVVFGAKYDNNFEVKLDYIDSIEGLADFRGSKYLQARVENTYKQCKDFLASGRKVMFSGTPCQIAGLKHFLKKEYENLLTVDFVCHGVPSPKVWRMYLDEKKNEFARNHNVSEQDIEIKDIFFRDKRESWHRYNLTFGYAFKSDCSDAIATDSKYFGNDLYMKAFLKDMILRPSCYNCKAKECRSYSDITIADYWGIETIKPEIDDNKGTGLIMVHTEQGLKAINWEEIKFIETTFEEGYRNNPAILRSAKPWPRRELFFNELSSTTNITKLIENTLKPTTKDKLKKAALYLPNIAKRIIKKIIHK